MCGWHVREAMHFFMVQIPIFWVFFFVRCILVFSNALSLYLCSKMKMIVVVQVC